MAKPVNLRAARKARERQERRAEADQNAARHGRTKEQKKLEETQAEQARSRLDAHRRDKT